MKYLVTSNLEHKIRFFIDPSCNKSLNKVKVSNKQKENINIII